MNDIPIHKPVVEDHGMFAFHDMACPVYWWKEDPPPAVLVGGGVFAPSWAAQDDGYITIRVKPRWFRNWLLKKFSVKHDL